MAQTKDPVCGMELDTATAPYNADYRGHTYSFCSESCQQSFQAEPERYLPRADSQARED